MIKTVCDTICRNNFFPFAFHQKGKHEKFVRAERP